MIQESQLSAHLDFRNGRSSPSRADAGRYSVFGSNGVIGRADQCNADAQTIIVGRVGTYCGSVHFSSEPCWVTDNAIIASAKKPEEARFWYLFLRAYDLNSHRAGSGQPLLNQSILNSIKVSIPDGSTRLAIIGILGALDDKIELNQRINETLEAMARAIFKDWFVDFGPTRAKMEGRAPYLAADVWSLFPASLDGDGKPEGWVFGTLSDVARQTGESVKPEALDPGTPYIGLEHMPRKSIALSDWEGAGKVTSGKLAFRKGDFLFGKLRPYFHKVGIAPIDGICSTDIVVLNARERKAAAFVLTCISQDEFVAFTDRTSDGTKMPRTSWGRMEQYGLCLPSASELEAFNACVEPMLDRIISNIHESHTLAATRDFLLPKLMSGEVRVRDAEKFVGEAI